MNTSTETLYLVVSPAKRGWNRLRIRSVSKRRPVVKVGDALVQINVHLPNDVLRPPVVNVEIRPEHIVAPKVLVEGVRQL